MYKTFSVLFPVRRAARGGAAERGRLVRDGAPVPRRARARAARQLLALRHHRAREGQRQRAVASRLHHINVPHAQRPPPGFTIHEPGNTQYTSTNDRPQQTSV